MNDYSALAQAFQRQQRPQQRPQPAPMQPRPMQRTGGIRPTLPGMAPPAAGGYNSGGIMAGQPQPQRPAQAGMMTVPRGALR